MDAGSLLLQARHSARLTQSALAHACGVPQPSVSRVENGHRDLNVVTLSRLVHAAGCQLAVLPTTRVTASATADAVREALDRHDSEAAYRLVIQLADDLAAEDDAERVALCVTPPAPTGDERYDAFIAGVVEHRLQDHHLPQPKWLSAAARLSARWFVHSWAGERAVESTPKPLLERGVVIGDYELASV